jgi:hypothetical protein
VFQERRKQRVTFERVEKQRGESRQFMNQPARFAELMRLSCSLLSVISQIDYAKRKAACRGSKQPSASLPLALLSPFFFSTL